LSNQTLNCIRIQKRKDTKFVLPASQKQNGETFVPNEGFKDKTKEKGNKNTIPMSFGEVSAISQTVKRTCFLFVL